MFQKIYNFRSIKIQLINIVKYFICIWHINFINVYTRYKNIKIYLINKIILCNKKYI